MMLLDVSQSRRPHLVAHESTKKRAPAALHDRERRSLRLDRGERTCKPSTGTSGFGNRSEQALVVT